MQLTSVFQLTNFGIINKVTNDISLQLTGESVTVICKMTPQNNQDLIVSYKISHIIQRSRYNLHIPGLLIDTPILLTPFLSDDYEAGRMYSPTKYVVHGAVQGWVMNNANVCEIFMRCTKSTAVYVDLIVRVAVWAKLGWKLLVD